MQNSNQVISTQRSCSCCGQQGHAINKCNSPQVLRFIEDATAAARTASSVVTLKLRRPFTNTSLPILKAVAANIRIESSVSNLTLDYLTHLLACFYWNRYNPTGLHANTREELLLLHETCRQAATTAAREEYEARVQQERAEAQQRHQALNASNAERHLQQFIGQQERYATEHVIIENQRRRTRQAFINAGLPVPERVAQPFVATPPTTGPAAAPTMLCLCCGSAEHNISNCKNYRGTPSMNKILSLVCTRTEFRTRLQQHPNLYIYLAFAIQGKFVPSECGDCVLAMNKITDYYYTQDKYHRIRMDIQEYITGCEFQEETDVIHDPRVKVFQSLIETSEEIKFNRNDPEFITKCIRISDMIGINTDRPVDITLGFKASTTLPLLTDADADAKDEDEQCSCAVCLGAWDIKYPTITFGCKHDMCSKCLNTYFKNQNRLRPTCHLCRQPIFHISVPPEALNEELFQDINIRILRQIDDGDLTIGDLTI